MGSLSFKLQGIQEYEECIPWSPSHTYAFAPASSQFCQHLYHGANHHVSVHALTWCCAMQGSFVGSLWVAAILCLVRVGGIWAGCWLGCWLGGTPTDHRRQMWCGMITQVESRFMICVLLLQPESISSSWQSSLLHIKESWCADYWLQHQVLQSCRNGERSAMFTSHCC